MSRAPDRFKTVTVVLTERQAVALDVLLRDALTDAAAERLLAVRGVSRQDAVDASDELGRRLGDLR